MIGFTTPDGEFEPFETDDRAILLEEFAEREFAQVQAERELEFEQSLTNGEHAWFFGSAID